MSFYFVKGPLYNGDEIMLCLFSGITPYYVCYNNNGGYQLNTYSNSMDIAIFQIANNGQSLYDIRYANFAMIDEANNNELNIKTSTSIIKAVGNKYQSWASLSPSPVYLAGESYQMNMRLNGIPFNISYVIPVTWYQQGACHRKSDFRSALANNEASLTNSATNIRGWTTTNECQQDVWYTYCNKGIGCSSACKAPCANSGGVNGECLFIDGQFQCGKAGSWWTSDWFLILLCLLLIVVIIYYLFDLVNRSKDEHIDDRLNNINNVKNGQHIDIGALSDSK